MARARGFDMRRTAPSDTWCATLAVGCRIQPTTRASGPALAPTRRRLDEVDDRTLNRAAQNIELERLWISGTRITDDGLAALSHLEHLNVLDISDTGISDAGLRHLETIESLESLTVNETNVSQAGVERLKKSIPKLEVEFSDRAQ
jgi:hypothetical protein